MQISTEAKVGIFVLIALGIFGGTAFYLGVFRFDVKRYNSYYVHFKDASGLDDKANVKIAGVKVGWVDDITLEEHGGQVKVKLMIRNKYQVHADARVEIRQESLLGSKFIEISPGSPEALVVSSDSTLLGGRRNSTTTSIEGLIARIESIAKNVEDVSLALKSVMGTEREQNLQAIMQNLDTAASNIACFTGLLANNSDNIEVMLANVNQFTAELAPLGREIRQLSEKLDTQVFPAVQHSLDKISNVLDQDFGKITGELGDTIQSVKSVAEKIDHGDGLLGKMINESEVYEDMKTVAHGLRSYAALIDNMGVVVDTHFESMYRKAEDYDHPDSKGYFNFRLHTSEDWYYLVQLVGSEKGAVTERVETKRKYFNSDNEPLTDAQILAADLTPVTVESLTLKRNTLRYGLQFGKVFHNWSFRFGVFENSFGLATDYYVPFYDERLRWVSTLEAFDFRGQERLDDRRPHLKWLNRLFILDSIYLSFGVDDFASKHNKNLFFGLGIRFTDDSLKYMFDRLGLNGMAH